MKKDAKTAAILAMGSELLLRAVIDTNSPYLANAVLESGILPVRNVIIRNDRDELAKAVSESLADADYTVICGGLGPAQEDITRETVAELTGRELVRDAECEEMIINRLKKRGASVRDNDLKQAYYPRGGRILPNRSGTAHGFICSLENGKTIVCLPGKPNELRAMLEDMRIKERRGGKALKTRVLSMMNVTEASITHTLRDLQLNENVKAYYTCDRGITGVRIVALAEKEREAEKLCNETESKIRESRLKKCIYGVDETPAQSLVRVLREKGKTVATAESCTGGLISKLITDCPGSSEVFPGGIVSYSNDVKHDLLKVSSATLEEYGAVSHHTAARMAEGVCKAVGADYGIAVTGIAGPGGGSSEKPVGLVYIGINTPEQATVYKKNFEGDRDQIRTQTAESAIKSLLAVLLGFEK